MHTLVYETLEHRNIVSNNKVHVVRITPLEEGSKNHRCSTYEYVQKPTRLVGGVMKVTDSWLFEKEKLYIFHHLHYCTYKISAVNEKFQLQLGKKHHIKERLDQGHLHPKLEVLRLTCLGW